MKINIVKIIVLLLLLPACSETKEVDVFKKLEALEIERLTLNKKLIALAQNASDSYKEKGLDAVKSLMSENNELSKKIISNFAESSGALDAIEEKCDKKGKGRLQDVKNKLSQLAATGMNESFTDTVIQKYWSSLEAFKEYMDSSDISELCANIDKI